MPDRSTRRRPLLVLLVTVVGIIAAPAASADTLGYPDWNQPCEHYPYTTNGGMNYCSNLDWGPALDTTPGWTESASYSSRGYGYRNCTDYVAWKEGALGVSVPHNLGWGGNWYNAAPSNEKSTTPTAWDAAVKPGDPGHVAFVESVNSIDPNDPLSDNITISQYNAGLDGTGSTVSGKARTLGFTEFVDFGVHPSGGSVGVRLLGDVSGPDADGKRRADAVVVYSDTGNVFVAPSNGTNAFDPIQEWAYQPSMEHADRYFLVDVNGDNRDDLIAFWKSSGTWKASLSSGSGFWSPQDWATNQGNNTNNQFLADLNNDQKADAITFDSTTGDWYVSMSTGSGFGPNQQFWSHGNGVGSNKQVVADFDGDHKADIAFYWASSGTWYVGINSGSGFWPATQWSYNHGMSSNNQVVGDVNGDGKADIGYYYSTGTWEVGSSSGSGFWQPAYWAYNQGGSSTDQFLGDVNGDGKVDEVTFIDATGIWHVDLSSGSGFYGPSQAWASGLGAGS